MRGIFITLEGVEGCGKTTQIRRLEVFALSLGREVVTTREPGGALVAEKIRVILLDPANTAMSPTTELLLYEAARAQHVHEVIRPALERGAVVISDRFADSTTAYQGAGRGLAAGTVDQLHAIATGGVWPDLTLVLDLPAEQGLRRAAAARGKDRIEQEPVDFHSRVREEFLRLAKREPERVKVVDATQPADKVEAEIRGHFEALLNKGARVH